MKDEKYVKTEVGNRIAAARKHLGLTQKEIANLLETEQTIISRVESGNLRVSEDYEILLHSKGISIDWIVSGEGEMVRNQKSELKAELDEIIRNINSFRGKL